MKVQDIYVYPVKSLGGIKKSGCTALQRGFKYDRRWMLVDESGKFISQRTEYRLALLKTELTTTHLLISHKLDSARSIQIPLAKLNPGEISATIWEDQVQVIHSTEQTDEWFSQYLGKSCRLVFMPESGKRPIDPRYAEKDEQVSLADAFPYLLIGQSSLNELNSRLSEPVLMNRFRPNLVVAGTEAFAEDAWAEIKVGEVCFKVAKPCARCVLTTVDQETGIKGKEPLLTLSTYRTINNKVLFGQNLIALNEGRIRVNDPVEVIRYKTEQ